MRRLAAGACAGAALGIGGAFAQALPPPSEVERRLLGPSIRLDRVQVEGPALLPTESIDGVVRGYIGRTVGSAELRALAASLTERLDAAGFVGSRFELPDQELRDGTVRLRVVAARLVSVTLDRSARSIRPVALRDWLLPRGEETLHMPTLQDRLALLRESGLVERVRAEVVPFDALGSTYAIVLAVEERVPFQGMATYANNRSPSIGARRAELALVDRSVLGLGDFFEARVGRTRGLEDSSLAYRLPVPRTPVAVQLSRVRSDSLAVDPPVFRALDITAVADTDSGAVEWTLARTMPFTAILRYAHDRRRSRTALLGIPFSFVPGVAEGDARARVDRMGIEAALRRASWSASGRVQWSRGATNSEESSSEFAANRRFNALLVSGAWVGQVGRSGDQARLRLDSQYSGARLLPFEKLAIGGAATVRGFRENLLLRDWGAIVSAEWRTRDLRLWGERAVGSAGFFVDAGWGKTSGGAPRDGPAAIASLGVALQARLWTHVTAQVAWAAPSKRLTPRQDLQDRGLHYSLSISTQ